MSYVRTIVNIKNEDGNIIRANLSERVVVRPDDSRWQGSQVRGVERKLLDRIGDEVGRATSVVRFAPDSHYLPHRHDGGEEIFVLSGVFSDEHGDYGPGTYLRNPIGTTHTPYSRLGCEIYVKLYQFDAEDTSHYSVDTRKAEFSPGLVSGLSVFPLHHHKGESVALVRWAKGTHFQRHSHWGGEEIFVIEGTFQDEHGEYPMGTWLRSPHLSTHDPFSTEGCLILVRTGHLPTG